MQMSTGGSGTTDAAKVLNQVIGAARLAAWTRDLKTGLCSQSPDFARKIGEEPANWQKLEAAQMMERLHPDDADRLMAAHDACQRGESDQFDVEFRLRHRDGHWVWLRGRGGVAAHDPDGTPRLLVVFAVDISDKKRLERRLQNIVDSARAGIWSVELASGTIRHSAIWYEMMGFDPQAYQPDTLDKIDALIHPDDLPHVHASHSRLRSGQTDWCEVEFRLRHRDGHWIWALARGGVLERDYAGQPTVLAGVTLDISDQKAAAIQLRDLVTAMSQSHDAVAISDPDGRLVFANAAQARQFGHDTPEALLGLHWSDLYPPEEARQFEANVLPSLHRDGVWKGESIARRADGSTFAQELTLTRDPEGRIICINRDITRRKREMQEQARLREDLQIAQRREIVAQATRGIAHDFNNLLAAISGSATLLRDGVKVEENATRILAAAEHGTALVAQLRERGGRAVPRGQIDLRKPLDDACDLLEASLDPDITLVRDLPDTPVPAQANAIDIIQVVLNLGINARDAINAAPASRDRRIVVSLSHPGPDRGTAPPMVGRIPPDRDHVQIRVADTGTGISPGLVNKIFQPAFTTKQDAGSGLGLVMVSNILIGYGGAVALDTRPGEGSEFTVFFPLRQGMDTLGQPTAPSGPITGRLDGHRILAVDDNPDVLRVIAEFLELAGAEVAACTDPHDALAAVQDAPGAWDMILTDYDMPAMTGADLAKAVHRHAPTLPTVLITAVPDWQMRSGAELPDPFVTVLGKPISQHDLIRASGEILAKTGEMK
ncbi:PAS domain S-box-containing protein [Rhodovulum bhavnagarense]|uniref:histidine kinase n=1 Tax=Rhodovulum bhavnagarense TaxID=992286 RepID=A0A4R2R8U2_9RHOB|nr:PAS domain-containing protein [Rhodovulum bhavnagarense]TCP58448.1 PAS domain S-box-containing protein [Rhodovulum bhavnagarense]